jgi:hypothetical protein
MKPLHIIATIASSLLAIGITASAPLPPKAEAATIWDVVREARAKTYGTDFGCVGNCTAKGYQYAYCLSQCSYGDSAPQPGNSGIHGTDYKCVNDCTQKGYQYNLCKERCSY